MRSLVGVVVVVAAMASRGGAAPPAGADPSAVMAALADNDTAALSASLRDLLRSVLPDPLYEDQKHWGQQKLVGDGAKWRGQGLHVHLEKQYAMKNDGLWWRVKLRASSKPDGLQLKVTDLSQPEPGRMLFTVQVWMDTDVEYERQRWNEGLRVFSGSIRARMRVKLALHCEVSTRFEFTGGYVPDTIFRMRVLSSDLSYDHVVVEHMPGLGGEAAKLLGETVRGTVHQLRPSLERHLLEKANAAIVKAGSMKEVRVSVTKLLGKVGK
jgi:hypothetical protein